MEHLTRSDVFFSNKIKSDGTIHSKGNLANPGEQCKKPFTRNKLHLQNRRNARVLLGMLGLLASFESIGVIGNAKS
jgi:hypothetical protein